MYSALSTIAIILFGIKFWWLYLLLLPLGWARVYRRRHTLWQVVAGALLAFFLSIIIFWFFGYQSWLHKF
jgi:membrane-associated phospholipid phosphatase